MDITELSFTLNDEKGSLQKHISMFLAWFLLRKQWNVYILCLCTLQFRMCSFFGINPLEFLIMFFFYWDFWNIQTSVVFQSTIPGVGFLKIHAPWNVLCREAEFMKLKMPTKKVLHQLFPISKIWTQCCCCALTSEVFRCCPVAQSFAQNTKYQLTQSKNIHCKTNNWNNYHTVPYLY